MSLFSLLKDKLLEYTSQENWDILAIKSLICLDPSLLTFFDGKKTLLMNLVEKGYKLEEWITNADILTTTALESIMYQIPMASSQTYQNTNGELSQTNTFQALMTCPR
jgi:hypothetical protein